MTTYNIAGKTYNAVPIDEFQATKVSLNLNAPNSMTFSKPCKFDATSISNLQKDVGITFNTKTLFTGKTKEIQQNLGAGDEHHEYSVIGANLEESYTQQISGEIIPIHKTISLWSSGFIDISGKQPLETNIYIYGDVCSTYPYPHPSVDIYNVKFVTIGNIYGNSVDIYQILGIGPIEYSNVQINNIYSENYVSSSYYCKTKILKNVYVPEIEIMNNSQMTIYGDLYYSTKWVHHGGILTISGNEYPYQTPTMIGEPPTIDLTYYEQNAQPSYKFSGDTYLSGIYTPPNGIIYVDGSVFIEEDTTIYGCIVATGGFQVNWDKKFRQHRIPGYNQLPAVIARWINFDGDSICHGLIYGNIIDIGHNFYLEGSIIATGEIFSQINIMPWMYINGTVHIIDKDCSNVPGLIWS